MIGTNHNQRTFPVSKLALPNFDCTKNSPTKIQVEINFIDLICSINYIIVLFIMAAKTFDIYQNNIFATIDWERRNEFNNTPQQRPRIQQRLHVGGIDRLTVNSVYQLISEIFIFPFCSMIKRSMHENRRYIERAFTNRYNIDLVRLKQNDNDFYQYVILNLRRHTLEPFVRLAITREELLDALKAYNITRLKDKNGKERQLSPCNWLGFTSVEICNNIRFSNIVSEFNEKRILKNLNQGTLAKSLDWCIDVQEFTSYNGQTYDANYMMTFVCQLIHHGLYTDYMSFIALNEFKAYGHVILELAILRTQLFNNVNHKVYDDQDPFKPLADQCKKLQPAKVYKLEPNFKRWMFKKYLAMKDWSSSFVANASPDTYSTTTHSSQLDANKTQTTLKRTHDSDNAEDKNKKQKTNTSSLL